MAPLNKESGRGGLIDPEVVGSGACGERIGVALLAKMSGFWDITGLPGTKDAELELSDKGDKI